MVKADTIRNLALSLVGEKYVLGNEPWYDVDWEPSSDPEAGDCSGIVYSIFRKAGVLVGGKPLPRETAHDYYQRAERIDAPSEVGDLGFLVRNGHATHVVLYIGDGVTFEAGYHGPDNAYPGHGYMGTCTLAQMAARGAVWGRLDTDIVDSEDDDMTAEEYKTLVDELAALRKVTSQINYDLVALGRAVAGDYEGAVQVNTNRYGRWPGERGVFPEDTSVAALERRFPN